MGRASAPAPPARSGTGRSIAAAVAVLAFGTAASGATDEAKAHADRRQPTLVDDLEDAELAIRLDAAANLAGAELYLDLYEEAAAHARAGPVDRARDRAERVHPPPVFDPRTSQVAARAARRRRPSCSTTRWMAHGCPAMCRRSPGTSSTALSRRSRPATSIPPSPPREENVELTQGSQSEPRLCGGCRARRRPRSRMVTPSAPSTSSSGPRAARTSGSSPAFGGRGSSSCSPAASSRSAGRPTPHARRRVPGQQPPPCDLRMADSMADRAAAAVALDAGDPVSAAEHALASTAAAEEVGRPGRGRALAHARGARARRGRPARAGSGRTAARGGGAARLRRAQIPRRGERELRRLGHRVHRRTRPGQGDGTGVARSPDANWSRAPRRRPPDQRGDRGRALRKSQDVETHMRNIFHKLDVSSRVEVARAVERAAPTT